MTFTLTILCLLFVSLVTNVVQSARNTDMRQQRDDAIRRSQDMAEMRRRNSAAGFLRAVDDFDESLRRLL